MPVKKLRQLEQLIIFVLTLFLYSQILAPTSKADGALFVYDPYASRWDTFDQNSQEAVITHRNGIERMMIAIDINIDKSNDRNAIWIFPVPSSPKDIKLDVTSEIPRFSGENVDVLAQRVVDDQTYRLYASQVYTWPYVILYLGANGHLMGGIAPGGGIINPGGELRGNFTNDVIVYNRLDKLGITSEVITAKTADGLQDYLRRKGMEVNNLSELVFGDYIGKDYSFVVSWISNSEVSNTAPHQVVIKRGLMVSFPTKDIYYPLKLTSIYGFKVVPLVLRVEDFVKPKLYEDIERYAEVSYYIDNSYADVRKSRAWDQLGVEDIRAPYRYTKIKIDAPSSAFSEDLRMVRGMSLKSGLALFVKDHPSIFLIILFITLSMLAGIVSGLLIFKKDFRRVWYLGIFNIFTLIALIIATMLKTTREVSDDNKIKADEVVKEIKSKGYFRKTRFVMLISAVLLPLILPLLPMFPLLALNAVFSGDIIMGTTVILIAVPVIIWVAVTKALLRVKEEDKPLYEKLHELGYSGRTYKPKDGRKVAFVIIYSIVFLIMTALSVSFLHMSFNVNSNDTNADVGSTPRMGNF